ncbi:unnamed protein product [Cylicocyclus nassatus]|uniref:Uncharacterized protein n=1 Tax=Cylicocyclus nassatus TaxID=53992 RepID=A0AA36M0I6_CYLNA|nr:unnamed protein product [Cylicocyclus nassatus]
MDILSKRARMTPVQLCILAAFFCCCFALECFTGFKYIKGQSIGTTTQTYAFWPITSASKRHLKAMMSSSVVVTMKICAIQCSHPVYMFLCFCWRHIGVYENYTSYEKASNLAKNLLDIG